MPPNVGLILDTSEVAPVLVPATPPPAPPAAPPPALTAPAPVPPTPIPQSGVSYIDPDSLPASSPPLITPGETVPGAPAPPPAAVTEPVPVTPPPEVPPGAIPQPGQAGLTPDDIDADEALAEAEANDPDLSDLLAVNIEDPFALDATTATLLPLKGAAAVSAINSSCAKYGIDPLACFANALNEGNKGGIGDSGWAYGPWQDHLTEFRGRPFYGKGQNNATVNEWAWSANGIDYSVRQMATAKPSARNLKGHAAVAAIVAGYERPTGVHAAIIARSKTYDTLAALNQGAFDYLSARMLGPVSGGAIGNVPPGGDTSTTGAKVPAGLNQSWTTLIDTFDKDLPKAHDKVKALGDSLLGVVK